MSELPRLIMSSQPYELNRALKPLLKTKEGIRLVKRSDEKGKIRYAAVGSVYLGKVFGVIKDCANSRFNTVEVEVHLNIEL